MTAFQSYQDVGARFASLARVTGTVIHQNRRMHMPILTHYFPPEVNASAQRARACAGWRDQEHRVRVVMCAPSHRYGELYRGFRNAWQSVEDKDGVEII